jgi:hypothetical protein
MNLLVWNNINFTLCHYLIHPATNFQIFDLLAVRFSLNWCEILMPRGGNFSCNIQMNELHYCGLWTRVHFIYCQKHRSKSRAQNVFLSQILITNALFSLCNIHTHILTISSIIVQQKISFSSVGINIIKRVFSNYLMYNC